MNLMAEIRYALRVLSRGRGYTVVAAITLALSVGATTAIFSMADAVVYRPYPFPELSRIAAVSETIPQASAERYAVPPADYSDWLERNHVFTQLAAWQGWPAVLQAGRDSQEVRACLVSPGFFALLGMAPLEGRAFSAGSSDSERNNVVISYGFWRQSLAGDPDAIGRTLNLNGMSYRVVGVMPKQFDFPSSTQVWAPWIITPAEKSQRAAGVLSVIGRLKPGTSLAQAGSQMSGIAAGLALEFPATNAGRGVDVRLLSDSVDPYANRYVAVISAAVAFLLILACANVANLQLARCAMRRREMALRAALGAKRSRIARLLFVEGALLSLLGAGLGLPLAYWGMALIRNSIPQRVANHLPGLPYAQLDIATLGWMLAGAVITGIAFTLPAALQMSTDRPHEILRGGGRGTMGPGGGRMRSALVICEIAFALVLLSGASLILGTFRNLAAAKQGFDPSNVLTFRMRVPETAQTVSFYRESLRRLSGLPEVASVALATELPALAESRSGSVRIEGQPAPPPEKPLLVELRVVSEDYFRTLAIPVVSGRVFTARDTAESLPVAVINDSAARRFWPRHDPAGQRLQISPAASNTAWLTVAGITGDVNHFYLDTEIRPTIYVPYSQYPVRAVNVLVKPAAPVSRTVVAVRQAMRSLDATQPVYDIASMSRPFVDMSGGVGVMATLIGIFALLALALSAAGVYAVMAYSVTQRTQEIGIRMALGAARSDVWKMVLGDGLRLAGSAVCLGVPGAVALSLVMSKLLAGIVTLEPLTLAGATAVVAAAALLATCLPARRATRVDPLMAMRWE
jgi:putative ABC transport system permease protein